MKMKDIILITGATRGIGRETAEFFLKKGYTVAGIYKNSEENAKELEKKYENFISYKTDVGNEEEVRKTVSDIVNRFGKIDCVINNAGISEARLLQDETSASFDRIFSTNMKGVFLVTKEALPYMINQKKGKIINISSMWGITGGAMEVLYSSSKAAVIGFTKALAKEVAPSGITVNAVAPGVIKTDMLNNINDEVLLELKEETPLNRLGLPEDIAKICYFLYSDSADFITGQVITADGGMVI